MCDEFVLGRESTKSVLIQHLAALQRSVDVNMQMLVKLHHAGPVMRWSYLSRVSKSLSVLSAKRVAPGSICSMCSLFCFLAFSANSVCCCL